MSYNVAPDTIVRRHPVRGAIWGTLTGLGIALHLVNFALVPFGAWPLLAAPLVGGLVLGGAWGRFGRIKALKGRIPAALRGAHAPAERDNSPQARRAAQLAAARHAQTELQRFATKNADDAMCAALKEAQDDVLESVTRRVSRTTLVPAGSAVDVAPELPQPGLSTDTPSQSSTHSERPAESPAGQLCSSVGGDDNLDAGLVALATAASG